MTETWTHIHFDLDVTDFAAIRTIQKELLENGVSFDSGGTKDTFEWHTDWSLEGPMSVEDLTKILNEKDIPHTTVEIPKDDD